MCSKGYFISQEFIRILRIMPKNTKKKTNETSEDSDRNSSQVEKLGGKKKQTLHEFENMKKLQLTPVGAFGFNMESMPQVSVNLLKNMRCEEDLMSLARVGNMQKDQISRSYEQLYQKYESLLPYEKRQLSLMWIKRNMLTFVRTPKAESHIETVPHILVSYSVGRKQVIADTHQSAIDLSGHADEKLREYETKIAEGHFVDPNATKRDIVAFLDQKEDVQRITATASAAYGDVSVVAVAAMAYKDPNKAYVSFYNVAGADNEDCADFEFESWTGDSLEVDLSLVSGESQDIDKISKIQTEPAKAKNKNKKKDSLAAKKTATQQCPYHNSKKRDASEPQKPTTTAKKVVEIPAFTQYAEVQVYVSQIAFSHNLEYCALLISGGENAIYVYRWQSIQVVKTPSAYHHFTKASLNDYLPKGEMDETARVLFDQEATLNLPTVTEISFSQFSANTLSLSGPNGMLAMVDIIEGEKSLTLQEVKSSEITEGRISDSINWTSHAWTNDGQNLLVACSDEGHILITKPSQDQFVQLFEVKSALKQFKSEPARFLCVKTCGLGFVVAEDNGYIHFYEYVEPEDTTISKSSPNYMPQFQCVRTWKCNQIGSKSGKVVNNQCPTEKLMLTNINVLDGHKEQVILACTFNNRAVITLNLFETVYSQDTKDDLKIKETEHAQSLEENKNSNSFKAGLDAADGQNQDFLDQEREAIFDLKYKRIGNLGFHSSRVTHFETCLQRPVFMTASIEDQSVRLWDYTTNTCELKHDFSTLYMKSIALHPSGYFVAVAFDEHIKIFHILYHDLEEFYTFPIKKTSFLKYSRGGQFLVATDGKFITVISTYQMDVIAKMQAPNNFVTSISFNQSDSIMSVVTSDGFKQRYAMESFTRWIDGTPLKNCSFSQSIFLDEIRTDDISKIMCIGQEKDIGGTLRIFDKDEKCEKKFTFKDAMPQSHYTEENNPHWTRALWPQIDPKYNQLNGVTKLRQEGSDLKSLALATNRGAVHVMNYQDGQLNEKELHQTIHSHFGSTDHLYSSADDKFVFSAGSDGAIFVYEVSQSGQPITSILKKKKTKKAKANDSPSLKRGSIGEMSDEEAKEGLSVVSEIEEEQHVPVESQVLTLNQLGRVVLIARDKMDEWQKQQQTLQVEMQAESEKVNTDVRKAQIEYDERVLAMEDVEAKRVNAQQQDYTEIKQQDAESKEEASQKIKKMTKDHDSLMEELVQLYERKVSYEQKQIEDLHFMKKKTEKEYQDEIDQLQKQHEGAIEQLLEEFKRELHTVQDRYEHSKRTTDGLKMINEEMLTQQEEDQNTEQTELNKNNKNDEGELELVLEEINADIVAQGCKLMRFSNKKDEYKQKAESLANQIKKIQEKQDKRSIEIQEQDEKKRAVQQALKKREVELFQKKQKVEELQKTKHVLAHRTDEMKASLEPKTEQIEALTEQIRDFHTVYALQDKAVKTMESKVEEKKKFQARKEGEVRSETERVRKLNEKVAEITSKIKQYTEGTDDRTKVIGLMDIYRSHAVEYTEAELERKKPDNSLLEEIDRKTRFLEEMSEELKKKTQQNKKNNVELIESCTGQNRLLINALRELRTTQKANGTNLRDIDREIQSLNLEIKRMENEKETKKHARTMQPASRKKKFNPNGTEQQLFRQTDYKSRAQLSDVDPADEYEEGDIKRTQSRGKLIRGPMFNAKPVGIYKATIQNLSKQLHETNQHLFVRKLELATLQDEFRKYIQELGSAINPQHIAQLEQMFDANDLAQGAGGNDLAGMPGADLLAHQFNQENFNQNINI